MTLDEQLRTLCKEHDLASLTITFHRSESADHRTWPQVAAQWYDDSKSHGRGIATGDHGVSIKDGLAQVIDRMNAERRTPVGVIQLEAA